MIECKCGDPNCTTRAWVQYEGRNVATMVVERQEEHGVNQILLYLTPDQLVQLIHDAQEAMRKMIGG